MKKTFFAILFLSCFLILPAEAQNLETTAKLFMTEQNVQNVSIDTILAGPETRCCMEMKTACVQNSTCTVSFLNAFGAREVGGRMKNTAENVEKSGFFRLGSQIYWQLSPDGPYHASAEKSYDEGVEIFSKRTLPKNTEIPAGLFVSKTGKNYIPVIRCNPLPQTKKSVWKLNSRLRITLELSDGAKTSFVVENNKKKRGRAEIKTDKAEGKCRITNEGAAAGIFLDFSRKIGTREDGTDIFEKISLECYAELPEKGKPLCLAELKSFCKKDGCIFGTVPGENAAVCRIIAVVEQ